MIQFVNMIIHYVSYKVGTGIHNGPKYDDTYILLYNYKQP